jgi:hypothetical protein
MADEVDTKAGTKVDIETLDGASEAQNGSALVDNDYEVELTLADQQLDPDSPLFSVQSFEELNLKPEILKGLINMNFRAPSKVQTRALPLLINSNTNLIGQSQSGTGKTLAFVLNILQKIDLSTAQPQALILAPTRYVFSHHWYPRTPSKLGSENWPDKSKVSFDKLANSWKVSKSQRQFQTLVNEVKSTTVKSSLEHRELLSI